MNINAISIFIIDHENGDLYLEKNVGLGEWSLGSE